MNSRLLPALFLTSLFFPSLVFAITLSISEIPGSIDYQQEIEVSVNLQCSNCSDSYLRGVFYPSGTNYFGFTYNNSGQWISTAGDKTQYFKIGASEVNESSWSGKLKVKPDPADSNYKGPGAYIFKVGRYTSSDSSALWSNERTLIITGPSVTPTPGPTDSPGPTATHPPTPSPTHAPAGPSSTPTKTPAKTPSRTPTPRLAANNSPISRVTPRTGASSPADDIAAQDILGLTTTGAEEFEGDVDPSKLTNSQEVIYPEVASSPPWLALGLISTGTITLSLAGYWALRRSSPDQMG